MKKQVVLMKWGEAKENYKDFYDFLEKQEYDPYKEVKKRWNRNLADTLWEDYEVLLAPMPNRYFADYRAWKIIFEKMIPFLRQDIVLVWHSLGWTFLAKYFNEEDVSDLINKINKIILVAPAYKDDSKEVIWSFNFLSGDFSNLKKIDDKIVILWSKDDFVVPFCDIEKYIEKLNKCKFIISENYGHYLWEEVPEIIDEIKS